MKLISINIEGNKHFDTILPFLEKELPDVLCLQEVRDIDVPIFEALGYTCKFFPISQIHVSNAHTTYGVALCSRTAFKNVQHFYYNGSFEEASTLTDKVNLADACRVVIFGDIEYNTEAYTIGTTHFTWSPDGLMSTVQRNDMERLLEYTSQMNPHVLCGDFNIPRHHNHLYENLTKHYTDTIPKTYGSSLDKTLHKIGSDPERAFMFDSYMVDYVFTQPPYTARNVRLQFGVSDHAGVIATITKS